MSCGRKPSLRSTPVVRACPSSAAVWPHSSWPHQELFLVCCCSAARSSLFFLAQAGTLCSGFHPGIHLGSLLGCPGGLASDPAQHSVDHERG